MRQFYRTFEIGHAVRGELTWTHYRLLLRVDNTEVREFYMNEAINSNWSTRELERQMSSLLFDRLALSKDREGLLRLSRKGQVPRGPEDQGKDRGIAPPRLRTVHGFFPPARAGVQGRPDRGRLRDQAAIFSL